MVYLYSKLREDCIWKAKQVTGSVTLLTVIIIGVLMFFLSFSFHLCKVITDNSCDPNFLIQAWILQHFPHIYRWASVETYTKDMMCATAFSPLRVNQTTESFKVYLDYLVVEDIHFNSYVDHRQTQPFNNIMLYYG